MTVMLIDSRLFKHVRLSIGDISGISSCVAKSPEPDQQFMRTLLTLAPPRSRSGRSFGMSETLGVYDCNVSYRYSLAAICIRLPLDSVIVHIFILF